MNNQRRALAVFALAGALFMAILVSSSGTRSADAQGVLTPGGRGTITAVYGGSGLTGSATSGSATLNVGAGSGITVGADAISADTTYLQRRLGECSAGSAVQSYAENGTPTCVIAGDITGITAGSGMTGDATSGAASLAVGATSGGGLTLGADSIGLRTDCSSTEGLSWDGDSWECSALGSTYTAGDGLTLTGSDFDVNAGTNLSIVADTLQLDLPGSSCPTGQAVTVVSSDGTTSCGGVCIDVGQACSADTECCTGSCSGGGLCEAAGGIDGTGSSSTMTAWSDSDTLTHSIATTHDVATSSATASTTAFDVDATGTYNTTAGALNSVGFWSTSTTTRASGANALNNYGGRFAASGAQSNYSLRSDGTSASGTSAWGGYFAVTGAGTNTAVRAEASGGSTNIALSLSGALQANGDLGATGEVLTLDGSGLPTWEPDSSCLRVALTCSANSDCCTNNCDLGGSNKCIETPSSGADGLGSDRDVGDATVSGGAGDVLSLDSGVVDVAELADDLDLSGNGTLTVGQLIGTVQTESGTSLDDLALGSTTTELYLTGANPAFTGMTGGVDGRQVRICYVAASSGSIAVIHSESSSSTTTNRFIGANGLAPRLRSQSCEDATYDGASSRWLVESDDSFTSISTTAAIGVGTNLTVAGNTGVGNAWADDLDITSETQYTGNAPTLSGCTSTCTMASYSTNHRGRITCSDDSGSDCTVTFADSGWETNPPACSLTYENTAAPAGVPYVKTVSTTAFTFDQDTTDVSGGGAYSYHCDGMI